MNNMMNIITLKERLQDTIIIFFLFGQYEIHPVRRVKAAE